MAPEEPKIRLHIEFGANQALAIFPAGRRNLADAVEHQHRWQRQLRVARAKQLATAGRQQILVFVAAWPIQHGCQPLLRPRWSVSTRFACEARQLASIGANTTGQDAPCSSRRSPLRKTHKRVRARSLS